MPVAFLKVYMDSLGKDVTILVVIGILGWVSGGGVLMTMPKFGPSTSSGSVSTSFPTICFSHVISSNLQCPWILFHPITSHPRLMPLTSRHSHTHRIPEGNTTNTIGIHAGLIIRSDRALVMPFPNDGVTRAAWLQWWRPLFWKVKITK